MGHWHIASKTSKANKKLFLAMGGKLYMPAESAHHVPRLYINLNLAPRRATAARWARW